MKFYKEEIWGGPSGYHPDFGKVTKGEPVKIKSEEAYERNEKHFISVEDKEDKPKNSRRRK